MSKARKFDRKRLKAILETYGASLRSFDGLWAGCYEQRLAAHSLEQLDAFYSLLFAPGQSLEKAAATCPPWPPGTPDAGEPPKEHVLQRTHQRIQSERTLGILIMEEQAAARFMKMAEKYLPKHLLTATQRIMMTLAQEVMKAKLDGLPVSQQLGPVDRLVKGSKLALRERDQALKKRKLQEDGKKQKALEKKNAETAKEPAPGGEGGIPPEVMEKIEKELKLL
jgi:hypothetical protein